jgi:hypothetical protein
MDFADGAIDHLVAGNLLVCAEDVLGDVVGVDMG